MRTQSLRFTFLFILAILFAASCGKPTIGYGVLLWSPDENTINTGALVPIYEESLINDTFTIGISKKDTDKTMEIPKWRLKKYDKRQEAESFYEEFKPLKDKMAMIQKDGLPMREEPDNLSDQVYRLRKNQKVKPVDKSDGKVTLQNMDGYWYKVLTADGVSGYCFDYNLLMYNSDEEPDLTDESLNEDETLQYFLDNNWYPNSYRDMIKNHAIDLTLFTPNNGLFPKPKEKKILLSLEKEQHTFTYDKISRIGYRRYFFQGANVEVRVLQNSSVSIQYPDETGYNKGAVFVQLPRKISAIVNDEKTRREKMHKTFLETGPILESSAYGTIAFLEDRRFTWDNYQRLVPNVIPDSVKGKGNFEFSRFLKPEMRKNYDGVISFNFENTKRETFVHFIFSFREEGVRFTHISSEYIEDKIVQSEGLSPIVIFFSSASNTSTTKKEKK